MLSANLYHLKFSNRIVSTFDENDENLMMNLGKVVNKGFELEWSGRLPHHFNYYASYSYNHNEQRDDVFSNGYYAPTSGKKSPMRPRIC